MARELKAVHLMEYVRERVHLIHRRKKKIKGNILFAVVKHSKECEKRGFV